MNRLDLNASSIAGCQPHSEVLYGMHSITVLHFFLAISMATIAAPSIAASETVPDPNLCERFRRGSTVDDRIAVYSQKPINESAPFRWVDIQYRPEYLFRPLIGGRGDAPRRAFLFEMYIEDGQPLPIDSRGKILPQDARDFMLLLSGLPFLPLEHSIAVFSFAPDGSAFSRTGEDFYGYERIEVDNRMLFGGEPQTTDIFIEEDEFGRLIGVLECAQPGTKPVPSCQLQEATADFQVNISGFRLDQMELIGSIKKQAREFTYCLTFRER